MTAPALETLGPGSSRLGHAEMLAALGDAYRAAAVAGLTMRNVADVLETVRTGLMAAQPGRDAIRAVNAGIATTSDEGLRRVLVGLKQAVDSALIEAELQLVRGQTQEARPLAWRTTLAMATDEFWQSLVARLRQEMPENGHADDARNARLRSLAQYILDERWTESYPIFIELGRDEAVGTLIRASLIASAAQIQLWQLLDPAATRVLLEEADTLAPTSPEVIYSWGAYHLDRNDIDVARERADALLALDPPSAEGEQLRGDIFRQEGDFVAAEAAYLRAIAMTPGDVSMHRSLFRLYGRPETVAESTPRLEGMVDRIAALDEWVGPYSVNLELADLFQQGKLFDQAHAWVQRSLSIDPARDLAHRYDGFIYLEEQRYEESRAALVRSLAAVPDSFEATWGLAIACEFSGAKAEALYHYQRCVQLRPEWEARFRSSIAEVLRSLDRPDEAQEQLFAALRADPEDETATNALHEWAVELAGAGQLDEALGLLAGTRAVRGDSYDGDYYNAVGNAQFAAEEFEPAVTSYVRAAEIDPGKLIYRTNAASTYARLGRWDEARKAYEEAFAIDHDEDRHRHALGMLANQRGNANFVNGLSEEAAQDYEEALEKLPDDPVVHLNLANALEAMREPGNMDALLSRAVELAVRAEELEPADPSYERRRVVLEGKRRLIRERGERAIDLLPVAVPVVMRVSPVFEPHFAGDAPGGLHPETAALIDSMRSTIEADVGVWIPGIRIRSEASLETGAYDFLLFGQRMSGGRLRLDRTLALGPLSLLAAAGISFEETTDPGADAQAAWIEESDSAAAMAAGAVLLSPPAFMLRHLDVVLRTNLPPFVGPDSVAGKLRGREGPAAMILSDPRRLTDLTQVLRSLVRERLDITDLERICATFDTAWSEDRDLIAVAEDVRAVVAGSAPVDASEVLLMPPAATAALEGWLAGGSGRAIAIPDADISGVFGPITGALAERGPIGDMSIGVADPRLRPHAAQLFGQAFPVVVADMDAKP